MERLRGRQVKKRKGRVTEEGKWRGKSYHSIRPDYFWKPAHNSTNPSDTRFSQVLRSFHPGSLLLYATVVHRLYIRISSRTVCNENPKFRFATGLRERRELVASRIHAHPFAYNFNQLPLRAVNKFFVSNFFTLDIDYYFF